MSTTENDSNRDGDDVNGHAYRSGAAPQERDDDTEGHTLKSHVAPQEQDDDVEGHAGHARF